MLPVQSEQFSQVVFRGNINSFGILKYPLSGLELKFQLHHWAGQYCKACQIFCCQSCLMSINRPKSVWLSPDYLSFHIFTASILYLAGTTEDLCCHLQRSLKNECLDPQNPSQFLLNSKHLDALCKQIPNKLKYILLSL